MVNRGKLVLPDTPGMQFLAENFNKPDDPETMYHKNTNSVNPRQFITGNEFLIYLTGLKYVYAIQEQYSRFLVFQAKHNVTLNFASCVDESVYSAAMTRYRLDRKLPEMDVNQFLRYSDGYAMKILVASVLPTGNVAYIKNLMGMMTRFHMLKSPPTAFNATLYLGCFMLHTKV